MYRNIGLHVQYKYIASLLLAIMEEQQARFGTDIDRLCQ